MFVIVFSSLLVGIICWISIYYCLPLFNRLFVVSPGLRSSHHKPKPSGGGIIFAFFGSITCFFFGMNIPILCLPLSFVGLLDDKFSISPLYRYCSHVLTIFFLVRYSNILHTSFTNFNSFNYFFLYLVLVFIGTAFINFINFMDGIDGLVSSCFLIILALSSFLISPFFLIIVSSIFPFLLWNWYPSRIFMGDAGSTFLGSLFFGVILISPNINTSFGLILIAAPLFGDSLICVLRRVSNNQNIFMPHRQHLYQRLHQAGFTHSQVSMIYFCSTMLLSFSFLLGGVSFCLITILFMLPFAFYLDKNVAVPFSYLNNK